MLKNTSNTKNYLIFITLLLINNGCTAIDVYDKVAYENTINIKVEALALMGLATSNYSEKTENVGMLKLEVEKAYEYAKGRPKNSIVTKQWEIMKDPNRKLLGGFLERWKDEGTLELHYIQEAKGTISDAFDQIIGLESGKTKPEDVQ
ncbi:hypothetical protein G5Y08_004234 [Vibrio parahaemolyticus]|nr:hypothetical protein [Vibrio parahaemolyticus]EHD2277590.1 hypothetical protein [Vibrio parahaemolyticus]EHH2498323.1 hypothetical protein [Vibrio parahaemolyticus]EID4328224.1 hypothetical protein [Vibrio parahaemolyticus]